MNTCNKGYLYSLCDLYLLHLRAMKIKKIKTIANELFNSL